MDIVELQRKMEGDLLESHSNKLSFLKPVSNEHICSRLTRSQTNKVRQDLIKENAVTVQPKRHHKKVDEVEKIYLNKKAKVVHKNLETIYEDPIWKKGSTMLLGTSKVKRSIYLDKEFRITSKQKSKLRKMKIKRLGKRVKPFKMSDEEFQNKMLKIENFLNESDVEINCKNEDCDVEFDNCDNNEDCRESGDGNIELSRRIESNSHESKDLDSGNESLSE